MSNTAIPPEPDYLLDFNEKQSNYNPNTKILATAIVSLAFVVAFVILLHLYIRRARSRSAVNNLLRISFNTAAAAAHDDPATARTGLDPAAIAALPSFPYEQRDEASRAECAVCLCSIEGGETVRSLPGCGHVFHVACIDMWLASNSSCPVCRAGVEPRQELTQESSSNGAVESSQEGTSAAKEAGSISARLSASLHRMLSRERSGRRVQEDRVVEDLERQQQ
ncbi:RING-H2 finger protein ATL39-like [Typha latifolia]|uniref:RING-H2 finger protein ATL39-like n=1 Tax=Typha latifolia TaxID=4733 RepID=UPI003C30B1DA